jgi:hypothetical protein
MSKILEVVKGLELRLPGIRLRVRDGETDVVTSECANVVQTRELLNAFEEICNHLRTSSGWRASHSGYVYCSSSSDAATSHTEEDTDLAYVTAGEDDDASDDWDSACDTIPGWSRCRCDH